MGLLKRYIEPVRNQFVVNEARLRRYAARYPDPTVRFVENSTKVTVDDDEHLTIQGEMDESVHIYIEGTRTFTGVFFNLDDVKVTGLKEEKSAVYFVSIMRHLLAAFQDEMCECGGLVDCTCEKKEKP